jgi:hypothetical protein
LLIQQTLLLGEEGDALTVGCRSEAILATLKKPEKFGHLQYAVDKAYGRPMVIKLVLDKTSAPPKQAAQQPAFAEPLFAGIPPVVPDAAPQMPAAPAMPHPGAIQTPQAPLAQPIAPMPPAYPDDMSVYDEFSVLPELPKPVAPALPPLEPISQASPQTAPQPVAVAAAAASPEPEAAVTNLEPGMMEDLKEAQGFTLELLNGRVLGT